MEPDGVSIEHVDPLLTPPGDSREQRGAEKLMIELLSRELGLSLTPRRIELGDGARVELDASSDDLGVLVEA